jgi:proteasome lid subunit RPN8/RPN11
MDDLDLATVAVFPLRHEAEIAKARLTAEGIPSLVQADDEGGLNPGFFAEYGVRLVVRREEQSAAAAVLGDSIAIGRDAVSVDRQHVEAFLAHARFSAPEEACGLLAFDQPRRLRFVYCLTNIDRSAHRFTIDPTEHFRALEHAERNGWEISGVFHSHPDGSARPSATDIETAGTSSWVHVILGMSVVDPEIRAFVIRNGGSEELSIAVR